LKAFPKTSDYSRAIFIGITLLILSQVTWWTFVFLKNVDEKANLELRHLEFKYGEASSVEKRVEADQIHQAASRSHFMFLSESVFFALLTCVGLYVLFSMYRRDQRIRRQQRQFIEMVSHESKTPLTALKLRLESIAETYEDRDGLKGQISLAVTEIRRLSGVLQKVLDWDRMERHELIFEPIVLREAIDRIMHRLGPLLEQRQVVVEINVSSGLLVQADEMTLSSSLQSVIENAVLYPAEVLKWIRVDADLDSRGRVRLLIEDNGEGISQADRSRIFDRFYRGRSISAISGTGLGLYLAKLFISAHRGSIQVVDGKGKGACFEIILPCAPEGL